MKFSSKTLGILMIVTLVVVTATMVVSLFKKTSVPSPIGDTVLKSSLFGMTINKGKTPSVAAPAQSKELSE